MEILQGDTTQIFSVSAENAENCTTVLILESVENIGVLVFQKNCAKIAADDGTVVFSVQLTSEETKELAGVYRMHFRMTDENNLEYAKLHGTLIVKRTAQKGESA